jgi:hypothetical protein
MEWVLTLGTVEFAAIAFFTGVYLCQSPLD